MKNTILLALLMLVFCIHGCGQPAGNKSSVGGGCEGCEGALEYGSKRLADVDTLPDYHEAGPKLLITGKIYQQDGKTPARDVILYVYHTDQAGNYSTKGNETGWGKRHGHLRGWIKTDANGNYAFYTLRPAPYPGRKAPAHVHATIKEPKLNPYWIDEYLFEDDPLLDKTTRDREEKRGGSGIIKIVKENGMQVCRRDIILGKNIPNY